MSEPMGNTTILGGLLQRMAVGDEAARDQLIAHSMERLQRLARKMLRENPAVHRWNQTDDVLQSALVRLHRALKSVTPESPRRFIGLAATQIRRELIDLHRSQYGPEGLGANHFSGSHADDAPAAYEQLADPAGASEISMAEMERFHAAVDALPSEEREVFQLAFYQGFKQEEIANLLAVSTKTVKRRWRAARLLLQQQVDDGDGR